MYSQGFKFCFFPYGMVLSLNSVCYQFLRNVSLKVYIYKTQKIEIR